MLGTLISSLGLTSLLDVIGASIIPGLQVAVVSLGAAVAGVGSVVAGLGLNLGTIVTDLLAAHL